MISFFRSEKGAAALRSIIILLVILIGIFVLVQYVRTKIKIESMRSAVKEQTVGAKIRPTWNSIIEDNILREAESLGIITIEDINEGTWQDKIQIDIYRPVMDRIEVTVTFDLVTSYLITEKEQKVVITEKAVLYDM